ncbi:MAG: tetratricopeptide repeat protein [Deltaproteobacteria bacterium]|nr:tetratricopeptide repeat protein [Deltaproteobacteria bacterium]
MRRSVIAILSVVLSVLILSVSGLAQVNTSAGTASTSNSSKITQKTGGELIGVKLGTFPEYSRLLIIFNGPVPEYTVLRPETNELWLETRSRAARRTGRFNLEDDLVQGIAILKRPGQITIRIKTKISRFSFRHFSTANQTQIIIDIRRGDPIEKAGSIQIPPGLKRGPRISPELPEPKQIAGKIRSRLPAAPKPGTDQELFIATLELMINENYQEAVNSFKTLRTQFPDSKYMESCVYLLGECYYALHKGSFGPNALLASDTFQEAITMFPDSPLAPRGIFMLSLTFLDMKRTTELVGYLRILTTDYPETPYSIHAYLYLSKAYLYMERYDLSRDALDVLLELKPAGLEYLEAYFSLGQVYFEKGLFTKAGEIFRDILSRDREFYLKSPEILYNLGEIYFNSKRPDLAREYLYHLLNIDPGHKERDVVLTRIGDTYKEENRHKEAKKIYRLVRDLYPDSTGAMVSQIRLVEYGTLTDAFKPETVFLELRNGVREATLKMYEKVVATQKESPLIQLAMFKIGLAAYWQRDYKRSLKTFKEVLDKYPDSAIEADIKFVMSKAILAQTRNMYARKKYLDVVSVYLENLRYISDVSIPEIRLPVAQSYLALGLTREAIELFMADSGVEESADWRLRGLAEAYNRSGRYEDGNRVCTRFLKRYPDHQEVNRVKLYLAYSKLYLNQKQEAQALFDEVIAAEPVLKQDPELLNTVGRLCLGMGQYRDAAAALRKATEILTTEKGSHQILFLAYANLGRALSMLGEKEGAGRALDSALKVEIEKSIPEVFYMIAKTNFELGRQSEGVRALSLIKAGGDPFWGPIAAQELEARTLDREIQLELPKDITALSKEFVSEQL